MKLTNEEFGRIIEATPLVAIDLIVHNGEGKILLGKRRNSPAKAYWFVPGGRILKNERLQDALKRIADAELGIEVSSGQVIGVFDHLYDDNFFELPGLTTHYVTIAYRFEITGETALRLDDQHEKFEWWDRETLLASDEVHDHTKLYFGRSTGNGFRCDFVVK